MHRAVILDHKEDFGFSVRFYCLQSRDFCLIIEAIVSDPLTPSQSPSCPVESGDKLIQVGRKGDVTQTVGEYLWSV